MPVAAFLRAFVMLFLPLFGSLQAQNLPQNSNVPMVAGHFEAVQGSHSFDITVFGMRLNNGNVIGWISYHRVFDNGVTTNQDLVEAPIDDLLIVGDKAYVRVGQYYFVFQDRGNGAAGNADAFQYVRFVFSTPTLSFMQGFLNTMLNLFGGIEATLGDFHVQD